MVLNYGVSAEHFRVALPQFCSMIDKKGITTKRRRYVSGCRAAGLKAKAIDESVLPPPVGTESESILSRIFRSSQAVLEHLAARGFHCGGILRLKIRHMAHEGVHVGCDIEGRLNDSCPGRVQPVRIY
jgi:hypothetical protein